MDLQKIFNKASASSFNRWLLNIGLRRLIPFNSPHKFRITEIDDQSLTITVPNIRKNKNHVNGIHACALATVCEYISGLSLSRAFPDNEYRLILKDIQMSYHYQAKMAAQIKFSLPVREAESVKDILLKEDAAFRWYETEVYDIAGNHICTGKIHWQIKSWNKTKTKR